MAHRSEIIRHSLLGHEEPSGAGIPSASKPADQGAGPLLGPQDGPHVGTAMGALPRGTAREADCWKHG